MKLHLPVLLRRAVLAAFMSMPVSVGAGVAAVAVITASTASAKVPTGEVITGSVTWDQAGTATSPVHVANTGKLTITAAATLNDDTGTNVTLTTDSGSTLTIERTGSLTLREGPNEFGGNMTGEGKLIIAAEDSTVTPPTLQSTGSINGNLTAEVSSAFIFNGNASFKKYTAMTDRGLTTIAKDKTLTVAEEGEFYDIKGEGTLKVAEDGSLILHRSSEAGVVMGKNAVMTTDNVPAGFSLAGLLLNEGAQGKALGDLTIGTLATSGDGASIDVAKKLTVTGEFTTVDDVSLQSTGDMEFQQAVSLGKAGSSLTSTQGEIRFNDGLAIKDNAISVNSYQMLTIQNGLDLSGNSSLTSSQSGIVFENVATGTMNGTVLSSLLGVGLLNSEVLMSQGRISSQMLVLEGSRLTLDGTTLGSTPDLVLSAASRVTLDNMTAVFDDISIDDDASRLTVGAGSRLTAGAVLVNGSMESDGTVTVTGSSLINGSLTVNNAWTGNIMINGPAGHVTLATPNGFIDGNIEFGLANGTLTLQTAFTTDNKVVMTQAGTIELGSNYMAVNGALEGSGKLDVTGTGTLALGSANTNFMGDLQLHDGAKLRIDHGDALNARGATAPGTISVGENNAILATTNATVSKNIVAHHDLGIEVANGSVLAVEGDTEVATLNPATDAAILEKKGNGKLALNDNADLDMLAIREGSVALNGAGSTVDAIALLPNASVSAESATVEHILFGPGSSILLGTDGVLSGRASMIADGVASLDGTLMAVEDMTIDGVAGTLAAETLVSAGKQMTVTMSSLEGVQTDVEGESISLSDGTLRLGDRSTLTALGTPATADDPLGSIHLERMDATLDASSLSTAGGALRMGDSRLAASNGSDIDVDGKVELSNSEMIVNDSTLRAALVNLLDVSSLTAANGTYDVGETSLESGTLTLSGDKTQAALGALSLGADGTLNLAGVSNVTAGAIDNAGTVSLNQSSLSGRGFWNDGTIELTNSTLSVDSIGELGNLTATGAGSVVKSEGDAALTAHAVLNGATLELAEGKTLILDDTALLELKNGAVFRGDLRLFERAANASMTMSGSTMWGNATIDDGSLALTRSTLNGNALVTAGGALTLTESSITGNLAVQEDGSLVLNGDNHVGGAFTNNGNVTMNGTITVTGTSVIDGSLTVNNVWTGNITINGPAGHVTLATPNGFIDGNIEFGLANGTLTLQTAFTTDNKIVMTQAGTIELGSNYMAVNGALEGTGDLTLTGTGTLALGNANTNFTGDLLMGDNVKLRLDAADALNAKGAGDLGTINAGVNNTILATTNATVSKDIAAQNGLAVDVEGGAALTVTGGVSMTDANPDKDATLTKRGAGNLVLNGDATLESLVIESGNVELNAAGSTADNVELASNTSLTAADLLTHNIQLGAASGIGLSEAGILSGQVSVDAKGSATFDGSLDTTGGLVLDGVDGTLAAGSSLGAGQDMTIVGSRLAASEATLEAEGTLALLGTELTSARVNMSGDEVHLIGGELRLNAGSLVVATGMPAEASPNSGTILMQDVKATLDASTLRARNNAIVLMDGTLNATNGAVLDADTVGLRGSQVKVDQSTVQANKVLLGGNASLELTDATYTVGETVLGDPDGNNALTLSGNKTQAALGNLSLQTESDVLSLSGVTDATAGTIENMGQISLSDGSILKAAGDVNTHGSVVLAEASTLELTGVNGTLVMDSAGSLALSGGSRLIGDLLVLETATGTATLTASFLTGDLYMDGGQVSLTGSTLTGNAEVTGGTLTLTESSVTGDLTVRDAGFLVVNGNNYVGGVFSVADASHVTMNGTVTVTGTSVIDGSLTVNNVWTGNVTINGPAGHVTIAGPNGWIDGNIQFAGADGGLLTLGTDFATGKKIVMTNAGTVELGGNLMTVDGALEGAGNLTLTGTGTLALGSANTNFTGDLQLHEGVKLSLGHADALNSRADLAGNKGTIQTADKAEISATATTTIGKDIVANTGVDGVLSMAATAGTVLTVNGTVAIQGTLDKTGGGSLVLNEQTAMAALALREGSVSLNGRASLTEAVLADDTSLSAVGADVEHILLGENGVIASVGDRASLSLAGTISIADGTTTLEGSLTGDLADSLVVNAVTGVLAEHAELANADGTLEIAASDLTVTNATLAGDMLTATGSRFAVNNGGLVSAGTALDMSGCTVDLSGGRMVSAGTMNLDGLILEAKDKSSIFAADDLSLANGSMNLKGQSSLASGGTLSVTNGGLLTIAEGSSLAAAATTVGGADGTEGTLILSGAETDASLGDLSVNAGGSVQLAGVEHASADSVTNAGSLALNNSDLIAEGLIANSGSIILAGSALDGIDMDNTGSVALNNGSSLHLDGTLTLVAADASLSLADTSRADVDALIVTNGDVTLAGNATLEAGRAAQTGGTVTLRQGTALTAAGGYDLDGGSLNVTNAALTGALTASGGTASFSHAALNGNLTLDGAATVTIADQSTVNGSILLTNGGHLTLRDSLVDGSVTVNGDAAGAWLTLDNATINYHLTVTGNSTLTLVNTTTVKGTSTIDAGSTVIGNGNIVALNQVFDIQGTYVLNNRHDGNLTIADTGLLQLTDSSELHGDIQFFNTDGSPAGAGLGARIEVAGTRGNKNFLHTGDLLVKIDGSINTVAAGDGYTLKGSLDGLADLTKLGEGTLTLEGADSSFRGNLKLEAGTLVLKATEALGDFGTLALDGDGVTVKTTKDMTVSKNIAMQNRDNAANFNVEKGTELKLAGLIDIEGTLIMNEEGSLDLTGDLSSIASVHLRKGDMSLTGRDNSIGSAVLEEGTTLGSRGDNTFGNLTANRAAIMLDGSQHGSDTVTGDISLNDHSKLTVIDGVMNAAGKDMLLTDGSEVLFTDTVGTMGSVTLADTDTVWKIENSKPGLGLNNPDLELTGDLRSRGILRMVNADTLVDGESHIVNNLSMEDSLLQGKGTMTFGGDADREVTTTLDLERSRLLAEGQMDILDATTTANASGIMANRLTISGGTAALTSESLLRGTAALAVENGGDVSLTDSRLEAGSLQLGQASATDDSTLSLTGSDMDVTGNAAIGGRSEAVLNGSTGTIGGNLSLDDSGTLTVDAASDLVVAGSTHLTGDSGLTVDGDSSLTTDPVTAGGNSAIVVTDGSQLVVTSTAGETAIDLNGNATLTVTGTGKDETAPTLDTNGGDIVVGGDAAADIANALVDLDYDGSLVLQDGGSLTLTDTTILGNVETVGDTGFDLTLENVTIKKDADYTGPGERGGNLTVTGGNLTLAGDNVAEGTVSISQEASVTITDGGSLSTDGDNHVVIVSPDGEINIGGGDKGGTLNSDLVLTGGVVNLDEGARLNGDLVYSDTDPAADVDRVLNVNADFVLEADRHFVVAAQTGDNVLNVGSGQSLVLDGHMGGNADLQLTGEGSLVLNVDNSAPMEAHGEHGAFDKGFTGDLVMTGGGSIELGADEAMGGEGSLLVSVKDARLTTDKSVSSSKDIGVSGGVNLDVVTDGADASLTLTSEAGIATSGGSSLTKLGDGTLTFDGSSVDVETLNVEEGTVHLTGIGTDPGKMNDMAVTNVKGSAVLNIDASVIDGDRLTMDGGGTANLADSTLNLDVTGTGGSVHVGANVGINGDIVFDKNAANTGGMTLHVDDDFTFGSTVPGNSDSLVVNDHGTIAVADGKVMTLNGHLVGTTIGHGTEDITLTKDGEGTLAITTSNTDYTGDLELVNGSIDVANAKDALGTGSLAVGGDGTVNVLESNDDTILGNGIAMQGDHTLTLNTAAETTFSGVAMSGTEGKIVKTGDDRLILDHVDGSALTGTDLNVDKGALHLINGSELGNKVTMGKGTVLEGTNSSVASVTAKQGAIVHLGTGQTDPGRDNGYGTLAVTDELRMDSGSAFHADLSQDGQSNDRIDIAKGGSAVLNGASVVINDRGSKDVGKGSWKDEQRYTIVSGNNVSGNFDGHVDGLYYLNAHVEKTASGVDLVLTQNHKGAFGKTRNQTAVSRALETIDNGGRATGELKEFSMPSNTRRAAAKR